MDEIFNKYKLEVVFYVVVYKYVFFMELSFGEVIKNNIFGILNIVGLFLKYRVKKFVFIFIDKVVNFINIMGVIKRVVEMII